MKIHCLGTAGFHPNADRHTSCYFLPDSGVLLDAGTGVFRLAPLIQTDSIDILLSHAHLDHVAGLTFLLDVFYQRPVKKVTIWGEQAKLDAVRNHLFSELIFPVQLDAEFRAIDDLTEFVVADNARVSLRTQDHPGGSVGYRVDWAAEGAGEAKRLVYLTDTTGDSSENAIEWCRDADLMLHECYFRDSAEEWAKKTWHSWTSKVIEIAKAAKPKKLLLTHINPIENGDSVELDTGVEIGRFRSDLAAEVQVAEDNMVLDF